LVADYANAKFGGVVPPLEAVFMQIEHLQYWADVDREHHPSDVQGPLTVLPSQLFFEATVNDTPAVRNILIANDQDLPALLESIAPHVAGGEFSVVPPSGAPAILAPGASIIVKVQFAPQPPPGLRMSSFDVTFNGGSVISFPVTGLAQQGGQISVIPPDALRFGIVDVGAARSLLVEVRNIDASSLHITGLRVEGAAAATFGVAQAVPITIAVATSVFLDVTYTPAAMTSGGDRASLVIESDDVANPVYRLELFGFGIVANMVVQPLACNFPDTPVGGPTQRRPVSIYATGPVDLDISGASFQVRDQTGAASPDFRVLDRNGVGLGLADVAIQSGSGFTILIEFAPTAAGQHDGTLRVIPLNANLQPVPVAITARGV
jgi:hypothetical protein